MNAWGDRRVPLTSLRDHMMHVEHASYIMCTHPLGFAAIVLALELHPSNGAAGDSCVL
jgi:hypothetical protein